jgi:acetyl esterase/lipase
MNQTHHPLDAADATAMAGLRAFLSNNPVALSRAVYDQLHEQIPDAAGLAYQRGELGGVPGVWCRPPAARAGAALLYFHGGVYRYGSAWAYRHFAGQLAARAGLDTFVVDYRLAPEHRFPAAVEDARAAFAALDGAVAVAGDSAGAALALALLAGRARPPAAGLLLSPWTDLALTGESLISRAAQDPLLTRAALQQGATEYLAGQSPREPLASPLYADLSSLPPVQLHVGTAEILLDDSLRLAARTALDLHVWEGMPHTFLRNLRTLGAARAALDLAGQFLAAPGDRGAGR